MAINCACADTSGNRTLKQLRDDLMRRLGWGAQVNNPPPGVKDLLSSFLQDAQRSLIRRYPALRTERWFTWPLTAGERFYDLPDNAEQTDPDAPCTKQLDPYRITWVGYERDTVRVPLTRGIPETLIAQGVTGWPTHYDVRQCIEIWPAPDATEGTLILRGHYKEEAFSADTDPTTIDDHAVFLLALANAKAHYGKPDASNYVSQLEVHLQTLVAGLHGPARYVPGGGRDADRVYALPKPSVPFA